MIPAKSVRVPLDARRGDGTRTDPGGSTCQQPPRGCFGGRWCACEQWLTPTKNVEELDKFYGFFGNFDSAARFCSAFDELRNYLRPRSTMGKLSSRSEQRRAFLDRLTALKASRQIAL
jgi:hypothetical protein